MKKKFGEIFRKKENLKTKEEQSNISGKENKIEKPKIALTQKVQNLKIKISQNKVKVISSVVAILAIILTAIIAINQASKTQNGLSGISPELAKAMTYPEVGEGEDAVNGTDNVKFDAFFLRDLNGDGYAESIRGTSKEIGGEDTLYMELNVQTAGYLKDAKITINGENFYLQTALPKDNELKDNYVGNNTKEIEFNQINNGTQKLLTGVVRSGDYSYTSSKADAIGNNINNYSKVNSVTLTGTYVGEDGTETQIEKTVEFNIDWYGTTKASIYTTNQDRNIENAINEEEGTINLDFTVYTEETDKELILSKNHIEGTIPKLNDYAPIEVIYTGSNGVFNYDAETMTFTLDRTAQANEEGEVTSGLSRRNSYGIKVIYPIEAYQSLGTEAVTIKIPVKTYYEGYNNPSEEFTNPYKSNTASATIVASYEKPVEHTYASYFEVTVGKYVYEPAYRYIVSKQKPLRIYNGESEEETDDTYTVTWRGYVGTNAKLDGMTMKETKDGEEQVTDEFIKTDASQESMDDVASNVGIYFSGADSILGENGEIKVYDEDTGNLLVTFTQKDWNKYTANNPYRYEIPVKHIRVETSALQKNEASLYVYNIKEIDDDKITTKYTREEFDKLQYIKSTLVGYISGEYVETDTHQANYEAPISVAEISISKNTISTQSTEKNEKITIQAYADQTANQVKWQNGTFLVKLPEEIIDAEVNNVTINNPQVILENVELIEQDGISFIKIVTKNTTLQTFQITIDVDLSPDPRIATTTKQIELYATNENGSDYYYKAQDIYDVNNNLNTEEMVNHRTTSLSMVSPNSLLTNQTATDYDDQGSEVVSPEIADIKPVYAVIDQEQPEEQTAKIGVQVKNNYASTISEIQILGKIPFEGNTYVISNADLGSTFTTKMMNTGIEIPAELNGIATVYYSDNETPDRDLSKAENNWKTAEEVENWDNIKTFLIDLGEYVMPTGKEFVFNYTVKIPNGLEFNQVSFSHHGVYFCLDTDQGKYRTETEPNKLGFRIAEKYDLELTKYQTGKDKLVPGATYSITEITKGEEGTEQTEIRGESKTAVTNSQGKLTITNLYAEKEYEIREINSPDDYELNENVIRFIGHVDEEGNLTVEKTEGKTKGEITVAKEEGENYKVNVQVEDEVKASIKITKKGEGTENKLQGVRFKLTGYNLSETGRSLTTNANGELTFNGLSVNQEYTLQEVKAEGYYLASPIKFKIVNNEGNYTVEKIEDETATGKITSQTTTEEEGIPTINIVLEDEKIPTYDLQLIKVKKTTESTVSEDELVAKAETALADTEVEYLEGAKFKLYRGTEEIGAYTTDETGKVTIEGLYQYEAEKDIDQTYTLKEVLAPAGYAKVKDITFKVEEKDGTLVLKEINEYGEEIAGENYTAEGNTINLTIEDSPSFKLIKKDAETQSTIPNVKFAIYNVDNGEVPATDSKGEIIGTKETINGKEYYTVSTDENGEITADLPEGLYKAVEVEAPEQYDISNSTYYFGIGASREAETTMGVEFATGVGGSNTDRINSVAETSDGGYIAGGYFYSSSIQVGDYTLTNSSSSTSYSDGMIIKYSSEGEVEWARSVGGNYADYIESVAETSDGGVIAGGYFESSSIQVGENTLTNSNSGYADGMIIKYNREGEVEWARSVGGSRDDIIQSVAETSDGGVIAGGYFRGSEIQVGDYTLTNSSSYTDYSDGMIIKYSAEGEVEWARSVGGRKTDQITSVAVTEEGGAIVGGYFESDEIKVGDYTLTNNSFENYVDGMVIKYSAEGEIEWTRSVGGTHDDLITSIAETSDGGYIAGGDFESSSIQVGDYALTNNSRGTSYYDGMIIKYSREGEVEWARSVGGSGHEEINSVAKTSDGGVIAGGFFGSDEIQVGDSTLTNKRNSDGMIIKYSSTGEVEWARSIGGSNTDRINSVAETSDGGYIAGGYFESFSIKVGDNTLTNSRSGYSDGMLIRYSEKELLNVDITKAEGIGGSSNEKIESVVATSDGGYIAGGYFESHSIQVGEYTLINNSNTNYSDGIVIKCSSTGEVEWAASIGGSNDDEILAVAETRDGGIVVGGNFKSKKINIGNNTLTNKYDNNYKGMLIKFNNIGEIEWTKTIEGRGPTISTSHIQNYIETVFGTNDGGVVVGGYFGSSEIQIGDTSFENSGEIDGMIIKYNSNGEEEWAKTVGGRLTDNIESVIETQSGSIIVGGKFRSSSIQVGDNTLTNSRGGFPDGMLIIYSSTGEVEWARNVGGSDFDEINSLAPTSDGGYIVGGLFRSGSIQVGDYTLTNSESDYWDGMVIKYSASGEVEWARSVGGNDDDYIQSIVPTSDGGYVAGGYFSSSEIQVGEYTLTNSNKDTSDGIIIKYSTEGKVEWAKSVGGNSNDEIRSVVETGNGGVIAGGYFESTTIETGKFNLESKGSSDGLILKLQPNTGVPEIQELTVENSRKEFKITTDVKEIDGIKGGVISGEDKNPYESVKYGENSTNEIKMTPDENYEIISITVNGQEYPFTANEDGTYTMPQFTNMTEDKHIEVTYALKDNKLTINKVDSKTKTPLPGATFKIDQIEERTEPENVIGELTANGETYYETDATNEIIDVQGELTNNGTYYFVQNEDGTLTPTNGKTYQTANGGSAGIKSSTANSYIPIDLNEKEGQYVVVVNAQVSSESVDYGYATITENTTAPSRSSTTGRFMYISGTSSSVTTAKNYTSTALEGGKTYYLHLGYYKDSSNDSGDDQVVINSIKVYKAKTATYNFIENNEGGYESNNQGKDSIVANSYIPIDLTNNTGKYNLIVNAKISSQSSDYGYATVTTSTDRVAYNTNTTDKVRFVYISGEQDSQDYTTVLQGGQMYYLHLGYYKNASTSSGDDKFTVNSIKVILNDSELYHTEVTTDSKGQGIVQIPFGKYQITETKAPEGYELKEEPTIIEFRADGDNHEITIENQEKAKVVVHHYLKDNEGNYTTTKVAEDELLEGKIGEEYTTTPHLDLQKYELEKDENGSYVIPEKAKGTYESGIIEVIYYYEEKEYPLIVHHYIEGTTEQVPLATGEKAQDEKYKGKEGEEYQTSEIADSLLSDAYELAEIPENAQGKYIADETIVTYYYKLAERPVTITKVGENNEPLGGVKFTINNKENNNEVLGQLTPNGEYYFEEKDGKIEPNNRGKNDTTASSYIKIDLSNSKDVTLKINAQISCEEEYDYGYAVVTDTKNAPSYSSSTGRIFRISGEVEAQDYEATLRGGKVYYLHLGYMKDSMDDPEIMGEDNFIINSISIMNYECTTDDNGKATIMLPVGKYDIIETETREDYAIPENPVKEIEITKEKESYEITIENEKKQGTVIAHYYKEGTEERVPSNIEGQVIEDEIQTGKIGDIYITEEAKNVNDRYELKEVVGEVNGTIDEEYKEIIYYYGLKESNLTIEKTNTEGQGLEGAIFQIENKENGKIKNVTTGPDGKITEKVQIGENVVTEIKAPEGYKLNKNPQTINIELDKENKVTFINEQINYFNVTLNKIDSETNEKIQGAKFNLSYTTQYGEGVVEEYETNKDGAIILNNLENEIIYTLEETLPAKGYVANTQKYKFIVHYQDGNYELEMLEGKFDEEKQEGKEINCTIKNTPTLKVIKQGENGELLANAKFTITDEEGKEVRNGKGELVGEVEEINGENIRVVTTDAEGRIIENLEPGKYILTEIQAPEGYELPENEEERKTEIEITSEGSAGTKIEKTEEITMENFNPEWMQEIDIDNDIEILNERQVIMNNGNVALVGGLLNDIEIPSEYTVSGKEITLNKISEEDGIAIIMNPEGKIVEVYQNNSPENSANILANIVESKEGRKIAIGMYMGTIEIPAEKTVNNQAIRIEGTSNSISSYMISYNAEGKIEWLINMPLSTNDLQEVEMLNDEIVLQYESSDKIITIPANQTATGEEIVLNKDDRDNPVVLIYNLNGKIEKVVELKLALFQNIKFEIMGYTITKKGEIIITGVSIDDSVIFNEDETVSGEKIELRGNDGIIVKYNAEGKVEWAKNSGSTEVGSIIGQKEVANGYVAFIGYMGKISIPAEETKDGRKIEIETANQIGGAIIKYTEEGKIEWCVGDDTLSKFAQNVSSPEGIEIRETEEGYVIIDNENGTLLKYKEIYTDLIANKQEIVTITNTAKESTVIVHHYIKDTTTKLSDDVTITGKVGTDYHTEVAKDIPSNYELVSEPANKDGKITANQTEVIYYYQLKEPNITEEKIEKESTTEKVTNAEQMIDYNIEYTAKIDDYTGKATVTIIDTLPYEIDEQKSNISGGTYNAEEKTITWEETIEDIDTYTSGTKEITITKQITLVYKDVDVSKEKIENKVTGTIKLETPEKEETVEDTKEIPTEYLTNITVNKIWNDNETQSARRPESIIIMVKNGDQIVQEKEVTKANELQGKENQWTVTFTGLPKYDENGQEIEYTVDEKEKNTNDLYFYDKEITEVQDNQATIRNTFVKPDDTINLTVTKNWEDNNNENNKRPTAIKVEVKAEGQTVKEQIINKTNEVSEDSNEWRYTFEDLPKYNENGEEIEYAVEEKAIGENDLEFYDKAKITGDMETGYIITNTFKVPDTKISVTVNKTWVDNDIQEQRRPESVVLVLSKKVDVEQEEGTKEELQEVARQEITLSNAISGNKDKWQYTFENLPKYDENGNVIEYTVKEQEKTEGDLHFYNTQIGAMVDKGENGDKEITITNTFTRPEDQTEVVVTKIWDDNNNEAGKRPESIKLQLKNGTTTIKEQEVTEANAVQGDTNKWQYTFTGIQKYDEDGQELKYTADETEVHSSDLQFYTKELQGTTIINTFTQNTDKTSVTVTKKWVDSEVQEQRRPESIIIQVKNGMEVVASQEINVSNALKGDKDTWQYTFEDLLKYDAFNNIINYTIDEIEKTSGDLSFYSKEISGTTITNTFVKPQDKIEITVNKEWVDQDDVYKKRPDTINLQVKNGEEVIVEKTVSKEDNWEYTFTNLDKYDENGQEINYTVDEEETKTGDLFYYEKEIGEVINKEGTESGNSTAENTKQATITNRMTKLPSLVIVKYVDINTDEEIEDRVNKEGIVGETFDVTEDKKDIPGYTLVEEPEEKTGTYTEETQVKTYYYAKNTKVIVKYLEKDDTPEDDADNKVLSEQITIEGYEGKSYSTEKKTIEGYTYVESKGKTSGKMEKDTIEVVYYYAPNTKVIVKYLEKDNTPNDNTDNKVLSPEETINGYVGKEYDTEQKTITNYTFIESTDNTEGTMTKDTIEVIYYYAQNTKVTVKYLEKDNTPSNTDNKVLAKEETIEGYEGQEYKTEQKDIENYVFVESTNNTEGTMTKDEIEVIYYYAQKTKAKVEHIDRETGEILKEETKEGRVGDIFETHPEDFEGYVLVESPKEPNIIMDKTGEQVVKYYYAHVSAGVIEKHIDEITGELLYSEEHKGNEGDSYDIPSRNFDGYDLVEEKLPENAKGEMTKEVIEVKYYYIKKATVRVEYIDKETGEKLTEDITIEGHEGDSYETEEKEFNDYNLVETPENAKGEMTVTKNEDGTWNTETTVTYYYEKAKKDTTVVEKHIDINTNKVLAEETHKGKVGDSYDIPSREFEGYELVTEDENGNNMLPENSKGTMTEEEIEVIYYYEKQATVKVEYIDKQTGEKLDEEEIKGHVGDPYETEEKEFDGYELVEVPSNSTGEMTEEEIVVKYYYQRKAEVEVQYLEKDTDYKLAENDNITGYVGDKYETEPKDIPYYKLVDQTENTEGTMTKEKITVTYYYEKQLFNLSVNKWVSGTTINGIPQLAQNYNSRDELYKIDIHRSKVETAEVKITYTIRITNTGEIEGTADRITELIPQGYTYNQEDNSIYWQESNGILTTDALKDEMIKPGEYKDIEIVLRWNKGENNFGQKDNTVILSSETNPAGYEDINEEDNSDKSEMLLTVATGLDSTDRVVVIGIIEIVLVISVGLLLSYKKKEHKK